jgi:hypothetical protein
MRIRADRTSRCDPRSTLAAPVSLRRILRVVCVDGIQRLTPSRAFFRMFSSKSKDGMSDAAARQPWMSLLAATGDRKRTYRSPIAAEEPLSSPSRERTQLAVWKQRHADKRECQTCDAQAGSRSLSSCACWRTFLQTKRSDNRSVNPRSRSLARSPPAGRHHLTVSPGTRGVFVAQPPECSRRHAPK